MLLNIEFGVSVAQHFLLSAHARSLSLAQVARMSDKEARAAFQQIRWADNDGQPYCPECGCVKVYALASRPQWKCSACRYQFSVTSRTIFADRKLAVRDYLLAIAIFVNGAKGHSALQLSRDLDCQYKTAFVLAHKLREAIAAEQSRPRELSGEVEVDGAYFAASVRHPNVKAERKDHRLIEEQSGKRQVVVIVRERGGRSVPVVVGKESDAIPFIRERVASGAVVHADESRGWDMLHASYDMRRINHSVAYSLDGACTNQAESFFSRLRRAEIGTHHRICGRYLSAYANEMSWREDRRRVSNGELHRLATTAALRHPVSEKWSGYWQRSA
jgi:transposase-like protein